MSGRRVFHFAGYALSTVDDGKLRVVRPTVDTSAPGDYGADPLGDGTFRMVPSGEVVDYAERCRRLKGRS